MEFQSRKKKTLILILCLMHSLLLSSNQLLGVPVDFQDSSLPKITHTIDRKNLLDINIQPINLTRSTEQDEEELKKEERQERKYIYLLGDSTYTLPLINPNNEYYLIGAFYATDPIICIENGVILGAITFDKIKSDVFKKKSPKSVSDLIEQGWYLCCPGYETVS